MSRIHDGQRTRRLAAVYALIILAVSIAPAFGHDAAPGSLHISAPWARATAGVVRNGVAYLTIVNRGPQADRLVGVASPVARKAALHSHIFDGGIAKMRPVKAVVAEPGKPAVLKPGGLHIMLMGLKAPLVAGTRFPLTLVFERAGEIEVEVVVEAFGAMKPTAGKGGDHGAHGTD